MDLVFQKKDGKITGEMRSYFLSLPDGWYSITVKKGTKRSLEQNNYYWLVLQIIADECGYFPDDMHEIFKNIFLKKTTIDEMFGEIQTIESTTHLTTKEFAGYVDRIIARAGEHGIVVPDPKTAF